jgi:hypothetical protein
MDSPSIASRPRPTRLPGRRGSRHRGLQPSIVSSLEKVFRGRKPHTFLGHKETRHPCRRSSLSPKEHARASAARRVLPPQPAAGGRARAKAHCKPPTRSCQGGRLPGSVLLPSMYGTVRLSSVLHLFQAFPAISTGIYSYPIESATRIALGETRKFLDTDHAKEACLVQVAIAT